MILKRLRLAKRLSQEQLAEISGLSVRTIQRIEQGKRASLESLKTLASALGTDIAVLEQEGVIDKSSEQWKSLPLWFRLNFIGSGISWLGLSKRDQWVKGEKQTAAFAAILFLLGMVDSGFIVGSLMIFCLAYSFSVVTRLADHYSIW